MLIVQILKTRALKREEGIDKFKILDANIKDQASQKGIDKFELLMMQILKIRALKGWKVLTNSKCL